MRPATAGAPALSIIVPFYDETAFLRLALNSIRAQGLPGTEIIVVNDNPECVAPATLAALAGPGVTILHHPRNLGLSAARNSGIAAARGRWIGFLDADDFYSQGGLACQLAMARDSGADITHALAAFTDIGSPHARPLPRDAAFFARRRVARGLLGAEEAQFITSSWSSLYRRDFLDRHGLRFDPEQRRFEDRLFVLHSVTRARRIAFTGRVARVWRGRRGSISVTATTPQTHLLQVQLLEKCLAHIRAEVAAGRLPPRILKRELFNTLSRLIWDMDVIAAIAEAADPAYAEMGRRIRALLGDDRFGHAIFDDPVLAPISRVGMRTRRGRIGRRDVFAIHQALRAGDFAAAQARLAACAAPDPAIAPGAGTTPDAATTPDRPTGATSRAGAAGRAAPARRAAAPVRLVLHLGLHKTGSTHLQHHLIAHAERLRAAGILVPRTGLVAPGTMARAEATPGHQGLAGALHRDDDAPFEALAREIRDSGAETVVISSENLGFPTDPDRAALIARLARTLGRLGTRIGRPFTPVQLVALARRPDSYAEAFYRERVAGGTRMPPGGIAAFLVDHGPALTDWAALFAPLEDAFGTPVALADFDALRGAALWPGFARLAGLPRDLPGLALPRYPTPGRDQVLALELLNALVPGQARRQDMLAAWFARHPATGSGASLLPPAERAALIDAWQARSQSFAAARGYAPDTDAWRTALAAESWQPPAALPLDLVTDLAEIAALSAPPRSAAAPPSTAPSTAPSAPRRRQQGETLLTLRLRPWAARAWHSLPRRRR